MARRTRRREVTVEPFATGVACPRCGGGRMDCTRCAQVVDDETLEPVGLDSWAECDACGAGGWWSEIAPYREPSPAAVETRERRRRRTRMR